MILIPRALPGAVPVTDQDRPPLDEEEFRITFLTLRGPVRVRQSFRTLGSGTPYDQVYLRLQDILLRVVKLQPKEAAAMR